MEEARQALEALGGTGPLTVLKDDPAGNSAWLVEGNSAVLRRHHPRATAADLAWEHAVVRHAAAAGWEVPEPLGPVVDVGGRLWCLTRFVPGRPLADPGPTGAEQERRGRALARLDLALRDLAPRLGQRPGWRALHTALSVHDDVDWEAGLAWLRRLDRRLADWAERTAAAARADLAALGVETLPVTVVHGDFAEWNLHYDDERRLAGVVDFGLAHLDSRPYELAVARTYRAPEAVVGYRAELAALGWPLSDLEEAAIPLVYRAFRVDMAAWAMDTGRRGGWHDLAWIESQLARSDPGR